MYEEICYKRNYIEEVICRIDFASPIIELKTSMPKNVFDVVKQYFPIAEPQDIIGTELKIDPLSGPTVHQIATKQWVFWARNRFNRCTIEPQSVVFSIRQYNVFEELENAINEILDVIMKTYPDNQGKRLGLRYINNISIEKGSNWIENKFFDALSEHKNEKTTRLLTTLEYANYDKDLSIRLMYGYNNPDYPSIMKKDEFVIDIDSYTTSIIYQEDISKYITDMHQEVQACFEKMITDSFRESLNS